jgi:CheY-like chemotaxis protein
MALLFFGGNIENIDMTKPLHIIMVEDEVLDCELLGLMLRREGIDHITRRVEDADELHAAIAEFEPNLIISDFSLPRFTGLQALEIRSKVCPNTPFFFHSGSIEPEQARLALQSGATGYAVKGDYASLFAQIRTHVPQSE